jgi:hypothetical protein
LHIVAGEREVVQESEHLLTAEPQPFKQITGERLLDPAAPPQPAPPGWWIGGQGAGEQCLRAGAVDKRMRCRPFYRVFIDRRSEYNPVGGSK